MDKDVKVKYQKYKCIVKKWEKNFKQKQGRIPSKFDIREAPKEIRDSYKMYYKLKTSFLENTLGDILNEDGFDIFENSQGEFSYGSVENLSLADSSSATPSNLSALIDQSNDISNKPSDNVNNQTSEIQKSITHSDEIINNFQPVATLISNETAWNNETKKILTKNQDSKKSTITSNTMKTKLNPKLFTTTSFSKRNPRKTFTRSQSGVSFKTKSHDLTQQSLSQETLPDLEAILIAKSQEKTKESPTNSSNPIESNVKILNRKFDQGWLHRCTSEGGHPLEIKANQLEKKSSTFGISNLNLGDIKYSPNCNTMESVSQGTTSLDHYDSDSVISNSEDESTSKVIHIRHIRKKQRILNESQEKNDTKLSPQITNSVTIVEKTQTNENDIEKLNSQENESKKKQNEKSNKKTQKTKTTAPCDTDTDVTESKTDDESDYEQQRRKSTKKKILKKRNSNKTKTSRILRSSKIEIKSAHIEADTVQASEFDIDLDLENGQLTSLPRVNIDEINQAEKLVSEYVNDYDDSKSMKPTTSTTKMTAIETKKKRLEDKIASGKLNENFVRIDMKKKIYVRGKKNMNYSRYKKRLWKQKKAAAISGPDMDMKGCDGGILTCFTCGQPGHFAKNCKNTKGDMLLPLDSDMKDDSQFPTLEEVEEMAAKQVAKVHSRNIENMPKVANELLYKDDNELSDVSKQPITENEIKEKVYIGHRIPDDFLKKCGYLDNNELNKLVEPVYSLNADGTLKDMPNEVYEVLHMFGHQHFRKGQDKAIMRILSGLSTLVTLSTGSGKSLCYQLPAYLYSRKNKSITLVISPLVSLMEDQVYGVPHFLRAYCLHTNQTPQQKQKVIDILNRCELDILLVSPEAIVAGEKSSSSFGSILNKLPPIAFACIDEAHCVSQWSHNFRPSYLMICKVLQEKLKIRTILGLTATATFTTKRSIIRHLKIPDGENGVISDIPLPNNLILSVSKDLNRQNALLQLLQSERLASCQSIIIYCTRRDECENVASFLRTHFQDQVPDKSNKRKRKNCYAEAYHAGMSASRRRTVQNLFMKNELKIIVATIAFGMGINKPDIRAIIHYNMPKAFESYVQEVGRAGRDGKISHCHLFLDSNGQDQSELRRHIYANSIDRYVIRKLLQKIFVPCSCDKNLEKRGALQKENQISNENTTLSSTSMQLSQNGQLNKCRKCPGHEIGFSIEKTVQELDIPEENISTLLCYIELDGRWNLKVLSNAYVMCKLISYGGPKYIKQAAKDCPPLAMAIALQMKNKTFDCNANIIEFPVIEIASAIGWNSGIVKYHLKNLEWTTGNNSLPKRSSLSVSFYDLGFRVKAPGDLTDEELDEALDALYSRSVQQERAELIQLQCIYNGLLSVAHNSLAFCTKTDYSLTNSEKLKLIIRDYFKNDLQDDIEITKLIDKTTDDEIINDVLSMINMYPENNFTGRTLARIFHGIQSPNYPAVMWSRCKYWRAHSKTDFNRIVKIANSVIIKMRQ